MAATSRAAVSVTPGSRRPQARRLLGLALASVLASASLSLAATPALAGPASAGSQPPTGSAQSAGGQPFTGGQAIVSGPGGTASAVAAVHAAGGSVLQELPLVSGVVADLPAGALLPGFTVADDRALSVASAPRVDRATPSTGPSSSDNLPSSTARSTLGLTASSPTGRGVTVAVVDTGIADVPDLAGRVIHVDVSSGRSRADYGDGYGHGTFVAGLVAGDGSSSGGRYAGAAPDARLLDIRVAQADGATSLISVLRGLQVVSARADELNIRVLNLSLDSGSPLPYQLDPLTLALEALWHQGITVVTAAGNDGPTPGTVSSPGLDPTLLTAGALDESGTAARGDDVVAPYSSRGPGPQGVAKPDLVAPGSHLISLRAPGSVVDTENPESRVGPGYFRGSGTSMSTALVSGTVADLLAARPDLTPDQIKALLTDSAYSSSGLGDSTAAGAGGVDVAAALAAPTPDVPSAGADGTDPTGAPDPGSLTPAQTRLWDRFANAMLDGNRNEAFAAWNKLSPEARSWVGRSWVALSPDARSWVARSWVGRSWVGADGSADDWLARSWVARSWVARSWVARSWVARSWVARSWVARSWVGRSWVGRSWVDDDWAGRSWVDDSWAGRSWVDDDWLARSWVGRSWVARSWTSTTWS
jgi:serine protease AprX